MSIAIMGGRYLNIYRRTAFIVDSYDLNPDDGVAVNRQSSTDAFLEITAIGAGSFGTVTVNGDVAGTPTAELLTFASNSTQQTVNRFDAGTLTTVDIAGWDAGTFTAKAVGSDGSRIHGVTTVATGIIAHLNRGISSSWPNTIAGVAEYEKTWFGIDYTSTWEPREGDVFVDQGNNEQWTVVGDPSYLGSRRHHHWEIRVSRNEGTLST